MRYRFSRSKYVSKNPPRKGDNHALAELNSLHLFNEPRVSNMNPSIKVWPVVVVPGIAGEPEMYPPVELENVSERAVAALDDAILTHKIWPFFGEPTGLLNVNVPVADVISNISIMFAFGVRMFMIEGAVVPVAKFPVEVVENTLDIFGGFRLSMLAESI